MRDLWKKYNVYIIAILMLILYSVFAFALKVPCPVKYLTGISCAGCGISRALMSAVSLDLKAAFAYHPLWITLPPSAVALVILGANNKRRSVNILLISLAILFVSVWIIRLFAGDEIVKIELADSAIARLFNN